MNLWDLVDYCNRRLRVSEFDDYCPNGLQVEAAEQATRLVTGVTASLALIEAAIEASADLLLVHHGYFWKGEPAPIVGMKGRRVRRLIEGGVSLLAYHLPLDAHPELGNNAGLGAALGLHGGPLDERSLVWSADLPEPLTATALRERIAVTLQREPTSIDIDRPLRRIAWCTGAAQGFIEQAAAAGCDGFISGEISEQTMHQAHELGVAYFAAGHHATERFGVQSLGRELALKFGLEQHFVDLPNPA